MNAARFDARDWPPFDALDWRPEETDVFPVRGTPGGHHDWWEAADECAAVQAKQAFEDAAMQQAIAQDREAHAPRFRTNEQPTL